MRIRKKVYSDFKLVEKDKPAARFANNYLRSSTLNMFRKRNFSILKSPSSRASLAPQAVQPSPSKRMRIGNSFRNSTLLADNRPTTQINPVERSPLLQRQEEVPAYLDERVSKIFLGQSEPISISNRFFETTNRPLSRTITPITTADQVVEQRVLIENDQLVLRAKDTPPPTPPTERPESMVEALSRQKADLQMEISKLDAENLAIFEAITENKENCSKLQRLSLALEDKVDISLRSFCEVRNLLNDIYNPGMEETKKCSLILEETKRRHSTKLEKLLLALNDRIETSEKATYSKEKELEHLIELHQRTLVALENQEREEMAKKAQLEEQAKAKAAARSPVLHDNEPELDPIQQSPKKLGQKSGLKPGQKAAAAAAAATVADKSDIAEDDCVIIDCEYSKPDESVSEVTGMAETPEIEVTNQEWVAGHSENNATCVDEEETDIEESKEDEDEGSFTPQQAQRV